MVCRFGTEKENIEWGEPIQRNAQDRRERDRQRKAHPQMKQQDAHRWKLRRGHRSEMKTRTEC